MKTFILLILLLAGGFAFWMFAENGTFSMPTPFSDSAPLSDSSPHGSVTHVVVKGDTLHSISRKHSTTVSSIQHLNSLNSNTIHVGDRLTVQPGKKTSAPVATSTQPKPKIQPLVSESSPKPKAKSKPKVVARKNLPKSTVMESSKIAIDIDARNQVYLKRADGKFAPAGSIIYGSDADAKGNEIKTITFRDIKGKETTLPGGADPESVIRLALKKKK